MFTFRINPFIHQQLFGKESKMRPKWRLLFRKRKTKWMKARERERETSLALVEPLVVVVAGIGEILALSG